MDEIKKLQARLAELQDAAKGIQAKADGAKRPLNADEQKQINDLFDEFDDVEADIARRQRIVAQEGKLSQPGQRKTEPDPIANQVQPAPGATPARSGAPGLQNTVLRTHQDRARWGFTNMGEFCKAVRTAAVSPSNIDARLVQNAALGTYGSESVAADGGFAVPPEWRSEIMAAVMGEDSLLSRCDQQPVSGNSITFPVDETTAWQTTGGIQAYWDSEASTITQSKPKLQDLTVKLHRLTALVPVTEELLEDAPAMGSYVTRKAGEKMTFKVNDAIVNGTGVGQPLGIMNATCKVAVPKETAPAQTAATFFGVNAVKMMARMPAQSFGRSVWLINQDVVPFILTLGFPVKNADSSAAGAGALYLPPNGLANSSAYGSLLGRPIVVTEACATVGTEGDVVLADLSQYLAAVKGALRSDMSIHLWFDQNITAFRFVMRMNGQPWLSAPIARKSGSNTLSHFVTLAVR